jgi:hypothetical protein
MASREKKELRSEETGLRSPMRCHRCGSLMISQRFYGHQEVFWGQRCISCGEIVDPIILENRIAMVGSSIRR